MALGLLIARLILGLGLAGHGAQKLFGLFGGYGISGTGGFMESLGWKPGHLFAIAAGIGELGGGLLTALGFLSPLGPALIVLVMVAASLSVHLAKGFWSANGGYELPAMNIAGALAIGFCGPGAYSLDAGFGTGWSDPQTIWIMFGVAIGLGVINNAIRRPAPTPTV